MAIALSLVERRSRERAGRQTSKSMGIAYRALKKVTVFGDASDSLTRVDEKEMNATPTAPRR